MIIIMPLLIAPFTTLITSLTAGTFAHLTLLTWTEKRKPHEIFYIIPYIFIFVPMIMFFYIKGIVSGINDKRQGHHELDFDKDWTC